MKILLSLAMMLALAACGQDGGVPTGAVCPTGGTSLTYDNFARPFMEAYCTRCHASTLHGADRHGAPLFHDFDTETGILNVGNHVDEQAAAGPDAINRRMPPDGDKPTDAERYMLGEWLACNAQASP